ncbi:helix-turn-helix domain-containing protein [Emticicia sp. BO119]|uniref:helix-turn-helix domain-containing protein n=1 Tax=Emticicia sp. BO119 TaxID=2757768 RepID=UPI0015F1247E|nr:helix-turn-helix domain-containing protein [Emticicia sp. BO119]MBA4849214.1 helix-turn-helix domain-containing protein [Emticicia sp. BO119]
MSYQEFQIPVVLQPYIASIWVDRTSYSKGHGDKYWFPNGAIELIFNLGTAYHRKSLEEGGTNNSVARPVVIGQMKKMVALELFNNNYVLGIRFTPTGFSAFSHIPANELNDLQVPVNQVFAVKDNLIEERVREASTIYEKIGVILDFLYRNLRKIPSNDLINKALGEITSRNGDIKINMLADKFGISDKTLESKFKLSVGLTPKEYAKICRLNSFLLKFKQNSQLSLTHLSFETNYYDQSHFIKEFKSFAYFTPKNLLKDKAKLFDINLLSMKTL